MGYELQHHGIKDNDGMSDGIRITMEHGLLKDENGMEKKLINKLTKSKVENS